MESGDLMSLNNTMNGLMNAARNRFAIANKMSLGDLTSTLNSTDVSNASENFQLVGSSSTTKTLVDDYQHFLYSKSAHDNIFGGYQFNGLDLGATYQVSTLVRGSSYLERWGDSSQIDAVNRHIALDNNVWKLLTFFVRPQHNIAIFCSGKPGDFMDLKNLTISKLGTVASPTLLIPTR